MAFFPQWWSVAASCGGESGQSGAPAALAKHCFAASLSSQSVGLRAGAARAVDDLPEVGFSSVLVGPQPFVSYAVRLASLRKIFEKLPSIFGACGKRMMPPRGHIKIYVFHHRVWFLARAFIVGLARCDLKRCHCPRPCCAPIRGFLRRASLQVGQPWIQLPTLHRTPYTKACAT